MRVLKEEKEHLTSVLRFAKTSAQFPAAFTVYGKLQLCSSIWENIFFCCCLWRDFLLVFWCQSLEFSLLREEINVKLVLKKWKSINVFWFCLCSEVQKLSSLVLPSEVIIAQSSVPGKLSLSVSVCSTHHLCLLRCCYLFKLNLKQISHVNNDQVQFISWHVYCIIFLLSCVFCIKANWLRL